MADILSALGGNILDGVARIISLFKISPEQAAEKQIEIQKIQADMIESARKFAQAQIDDASSNIQAEAKGGSKARPAFMWIIEFILLFNYIVAPLFNILSKWAHQSYALETLSLPTNLLMLFGVCLTGYTAFDKIGEIMNLPGESKVSGIGFSVSNNGGKSK